MAPSNLNQVFIVNNVTLLTGTTFNVSAATANASRLGIWNIDAIATGTGTANSYLTPAGSAWTGTLTDLRRIQFTQSTLGNIISTPIIDVQNIVRINYNGFAADAQSNAVITWDPATAPAMGTTKNVMVRIALRTAPTNYESFANPANLNLDTTGAGRIFPLLGNFAAGRQIFNVEIPVVSTANATAACNFVRAAIAANPTLNSIFATSGTTTLVMTARHVGVEFDVVVQYSDGTGQVGVVTPSRTTPATNYTQAISAEKAQRSKYGNFNRMYFPTPQVDYAQPGYAYDMLEIQYKHDHPSSTGIARANEINTLKIFFGSSSTPLAAASDFVVPFGIVIGTDEEQATDAVLQSNT
jgi:hypothetical protein